MEQVDTTEQALRAAAIEASMWISGDGRVLEADAATLLGLALRTLQNKRGNGTAPPTYKVGARITYRLHDLAQWIEAHRDHS